MTQSLPNIHSIFNESISTVLWEKHLYKRFIPELTTVVAYFDPELTLEDGQYIRISGTVIDVFEGENMMGG